MVEIKAGVEFSVVAPAGIRILEVLKQLSGEFPVVITSGTDGKHSSPADPHYSGQAYDIRTQNMSEPEKQRFLKQLLDKLGARFTAFIENPGLPAEHVHVQRTYLTTYSMQDYLRSA